MIPLSTIARFSSDGRVFMAFDHYIAAGNGYLLLVPVGLAYRNGEVEVTSGCPVPVDEVVGLLDSLPPTARPLLPGTPLWAKLSPLGQEGWSYAVEPIMPQAWRKVMHAANESGIRYAKVVR